MRLAAVVTGDNWPSANREDNDERVSIKGGGDLSFDGKWNSSERLLVLVDELAITVLIARVLTV